MLQILEGKCQVCNKIYEYGDTIDPNEYEHAEYNMCVSCHENNNLYCVEVQTFNRKQGHPMEGELHSIGVFYIDPTLPEWRKAFNENVTSDTALCKVVNCPDDKNIVHVDDTLKLMQEVGIMMVKGEKVEIPEDYLQPIAPYTERVLQDVAEHRQVQIGVWGIQENSPEMWQLIAQEEFGEIADAIQKHYRNPSEQTMTHIYEETIQTIGVLTAFAESLLRKKPDLQMPYYDITKLRKDRGLE